MRWSVALVVAASVGTATANEQLSNPAFLGIGMRDLSSGPMTGAATGPCQVTTVTRGSGAKQAGIQDGDILRAIENKPVANCDAVLKAVQAKAPGDVVTIDVLRGGTTVSLSATLLSRDEILRRRLVGSPVVATDLYGVDEDRRYDLSANRGKTTIVGWFDPDCTTCKDVFAKLAAWARKQDEKPGSPIVPLAVTRDLRPIESARSTAYKSTANAIDIPLALAEPALYEEFTIPDRERVHFTVVDGRGVVQHVAPIASDGADTDAALDELFAAAEQAARSSLKR